MQTTTTKRCDCCKRTIDRRDVSAVSDVCFACERRCTWRTCKIG